MKKKLLLSKVKEEYSNGHNMMHYLNYEKGQNEIEDVMISYDFQAGTAIENYENKGQLYHTTIGRVREMIRVGREIGITTLDTILEAGSGDGTFISHLLESINYNQAYAFDLCWSRAYMALQYTEKKQIRNLSVFQGNLLQIPIMDNSMDLVYTVEAIEPNTGKEKEILEELYRVARKYIFLIEPLYEMVDNSVKERMNRLGYVKELSKCISELGYEVIYSKLLPEDCYPKTTPVSLTVIKKPFSVEDRIDSKSPYYDVFIDPATGSRLHDYDDSYWSDESMLAYPIVKGVPVLMEQNSIIATHYPWKKN